MATQLIPLKEGFQVEVEVDEQHTEQVSSMGDRVEGALADVHGLLSQAVAPVTVVWGEMNRDLNISQVEIELALGFAAEGNLFLAKGKGSANITFKLTVQPSESE